MQKTRHQKSHASVPLNGAWGYEFNPGKSLNGASSRILHVPGKKSRFLERPETFFPLKWSRATARGHFGAQNVETVETVSLMYYKEIEKGYILTNADN